MALRTNPLLPLFGLLLACLPASMSASDTQGALSAVGIATPDGTRWTLGTQGVGRPFEVRLVLGNLGPDSLRIWRPESPDGSHLAWVVLRDSAGRETKLEWPAKPRFGRGASVVLLPHETAVYSLELLRATGIESLVAGDYQLVAHYANRNAGDGQSSGVWTGEITSDPLTIQIVRPEKDP